MRRVRPVASIEQPAAHQRNAHRGEVAFAGDAIAGEANTVLQLIAQPVAVFETLDLIDPGHLDELPVVEVGDAKRKGVDEPRLLHAGQGGQSREDLLLRRLAPLLHIGLAGKRPRQVEQHGAFSAIAGIDLEELAEAPRQQPRARQQDNRQRHLRDDERLAHAFARPAPGHRSRALGERIADIVLRRTHRRRHTKGRRRRRCHGNCKDHHSPIDLYGLQAREVGRLQGDERLHAQVCEADADDGGGDSEDQCFGQELTRDAAASGADRQAHRQLAPARGGAGQLQIGHIQARNDQEQHGSAKQDPQRRSRRRRELFAQRHGDRVRHPGLVAVSRLQRSR